MKLSEKEQRELDYKIQVYELAKKRKDQAAAEAALWDEATGATRNSAPKVS